MCLHLYVDKRKYTDWWEETSYKRWRNDNTFLKRLREKKSVVCWKIVERTGNRIASNVKHYIIPVGWYRSNRLQYCLDCWLSPVEKSTGQVNYGIHVYTEPFSKSRSGSVVFLPVRVYFKDLVAIGRDGEAVFEKVFVEKRTFQRLGIKVP